MAGRKKEGRAQDALVELINFQRWFLLNRGSDDPVSPHLAFLFAELSIQQRWRDHIHYRALAAREKYLDILRR